MLVWLIALPALLVAQAEPPQIEKLELLQTPLQITPTTNHQIYRLGEPVAVRVMVCNPTGDVHTEQRGCPCSGDDGCLCCDRLSIVDSAGEEVAYLDEPPWMCPGTSITIDVAPGACQAATRLVWPQSTGGFPFGSATGQVGPGTYRVRVSWDGVVFESAPFQITAQQFQAPIPTTSHIGSMVLMLLIAAAGTILRYR
jgi:hypothetical protein